MRAPRGRRLACGIALALAASTWTGVSSAAAPEPAAGAAADPCAEPSVLAEPAACGSDRAPAARESSGGVAGRVPVVAGNAFADGLVAAGGGETDKLTFPPGNMVGPQQVADEVSGINIYGYDFSVDGSVLYGVDDTLDSLVTINQSTGVATTVGPMTLADAGANWVDLTIDPVTGAAFAASTSPSAYTLYRVNLATGATTVVNTVSTTTLPIDLSMNCAGELYALTVGDHALYRVDPATAAITSVGPIGVLNSFAQGIDFDNATGVLHAWLYIGSGVNQYSSLNTTTGVATAFPGTEPLGEFEGAIRTSCPPPAVLVTAGPEGKTAQLRPTFSFTTSNATTVECSLDRGTPSFAACPGTSYLPAADLAPGSWTFRVRGTRGPLVAQATRAFTVVDCATLKASVAKAKQKVKKAKAKLKAAKATGDEKKIKKATKKLKKAKAKRKLAKAALKAEPVCV